MLSEQYQSISKKAMYLNDWTHPCGGSGVVVDIVASSFIVTLLLPAWRQLR